MLATGLLVADVLYWHVSMVLVFSTLKFLLIDTVDSGCLVFW